MNGFGKYYEAYDDRYRQVHEQDLRWFMDGPSPIVEEILSKFPVLKSAKLLEIGCGEGRDAKYLLNQGYDLLATDISAEAISYCKQENPGFAEHFRVLDCISQRTESKFDFIYAVAVIHMLVLEEDRNGFYGFIHDQLAEKGIGLICSMGDGEQEYQSDISTAFTRQKRIHQRTGRAVRIAGTSCRIVSFRSFERELNANGLVILKLGMTSIEPDFPQMMYAVVKRKADLPG